MKSAYAIVRVDELHEPSVALENRITIKRVVRTQALAQAEVERLNGLNSEKDCRYFWQTTRVDEDV